MLHFSLINHYDIFTRQMVWKDGCIYYVQVWCDTGCYLSSIRPTSFKVLMAKLTDLNSSRSPSKGHVCTVRALLDLEGPGHSRAKLDGMINSHILLDGFESQFFVKNGMLSIYRKAPKATSSLKERLLGVPREMMWSMAGFPTNGRFFHLARATLGPSIRLCKKLFPAIDEWHDWLAAKELSPDDPI
jgi:hypothetical protein